MSYDISILIPAIRTIRWLPLYNSIKLAAKRYNWELVLVSPFDLPEELKEYNNIRLIKEYGQVSRAVQRGMLELGSDLVFLTVDDCTLVEDSLDLAIDEYKKNCTYDDVLNVRYSENGDIQPKEYYWAYYHQSTRLLGIEDSWQGYPLFYEDRGSHSRTNEHNLCRRQNSHTRCIHKF